MFHFGRYLLRHIRDLSAIYELRVVISDYICQYTFPLDTFEYDYLQSNVILNHIHHKHMPLCQM